MVVARLKCSQLLRWYLQLVHYNLLLVLSTLVLIYDQRFCILSAHASPNYTFENTFLRDITCAFEYAFLFPHTEQYHLELLASQYGLIYAPQCTQRAISFTFFERFPIVRELQ